MADFLLELLSEEIPARMQDKARADLARLFEERLSEAGPKAEAVETYATPRRLALIARGLPDATESLSEELKGPRTSAPEQALEGFLRKTGLSKDQLEERDGIWCAVIDKPGRPTAEVLAEAIPAIARAFAWPKSMRWGAASIATDSPRWVRPLHAIVALLGEQVVDFEIAGIRSGAATLGHRFHHPGPITIGGAHDYVEKLRACHVIVDSEERRRIIAEGAARLAADAGLALVEDEGLLAENAGLTEYPVPLLGGFDPAFLDVPREVIQLTMRANQKYFALTHSSPAFAGEGDEQVALSPGQGLGSRGDPNLLIAKHGGGASSTLAPAFICVANIDATDGGASIVDGNRKVLAARLADARFFWEQDLKVPLEEQAAKLSQIVFHEKLGTVADKVERVAKLARWLVEEGIVGGTKISGTSDVGRLADMAERAARLCKADLVTGLVGEFPELQGIVGGHLARAQGEPDAVADAIRDHYKPVGQGDEVPTASVTVVVSLADKLDTIGRFFAIEEYPTGSKDPFALRRAVLGVIALITQNQLRLSYDSAAFFGITGGRKLTEDEAVRSTFMRPYTTLHFFFADRLKVQQREAGVRHDLIDAVFALGGEDDLVRLLARVKALQSFVETAEGADLLAGYKRAANILKKEGWNDKPLPFRGGVGGGAGETSPGSPSLTVGPHPNPSPEEEGQKRQLSYTPENDEAALIAALDAAEPRAAEAVEREDFEGAMAALASLRAPVDAFFDKVTVNDADPDKRDARLALLARMREAVHRVADFSRIEG